jgi:malonyl-CoA O-methyltransferase
VTAFKQRVVRAFDAATDYDRLAGIQQQVAAALARRIGGLPEGARVLEVGCGTGFVAAAVEDHAADWLMTDVSPAMVERSRKRFGERPGYRFAVLDAEHPQFATPEGPFDLVCSSLAAQWFENMPQALEQLFGLLKPGGRLLVSTLAEGTFAEWRAAHEALGLAAGTPSYPDRVTLEAIRLDGVPRRIDIERFTSSYASGREFLRSLRAIGAATPRPGHQPLSPHRMRKVLQRFEEDGAKVSWHVAFCTFEAVR